jgi:hypothetical protein
MHFIEDEDDEVNRIREIMTYTVEQKDPYGFLYFVPNKAHKVIPEVLQGAFTTTTEVEKAIVKYNSLNA